MRFPRETASWAYVFGSAALTVFMLQLVTGILLALIYVPSAGEAWNSLQILNHQVALGWFIRALHGWGSNFMVAIVLIHMVQVFLFGAYKFPARTDLDFGIFLLLMTLGMAFTGQVLRFDQDAYWGLGIGASISSRIPVVGPWIVNLLLGGPIIAAATLSRFFALHVFVIPGLLIAFVGLHFFWCSSWESMSGPCRAGLSAARLHRGVSRADAQGRDAVRARGDREGHVFLRVCPSCSRRVRAVFRSVRAERPARSHHHPDGPAAGLLLSVAVCGSFAAATLDGDSGIADRPRYRAGLSSRAPVFFR